MSTLPVRGSGAIKLHERKPYDRVPPSPAPQLARSKSSFFNTVRTIFSGWFSGGDSANGPADREREDKHIKRRSSRSKLENGPRSKRIRTVSPQRTLAPKAGYLDPPERMLRPGGSLGRSSKLAVTSDTEQGHLSVRNTPLGFGTYRPPRSPSRRTPSISSWFPQPASTRNSLAPKASQVHFGIPSNLEIDTAISHYDDSRMQSRSPSVGVGVGLGRERTPSKAIPGREASLSLPTGGRTSLSRATGSSQRASLSTANPFSSLGKSASLAPERRKSNLVWDDTVGVTKVKGGKSRAPSAPPAKNTAERLLNALENMHTLTGDAQRPRRRPPPYVQVPTPGPGDRRARMIQPYGEVKISPNKPKKSGESRRKSGLMKMLMKNRKEIEEEDMDMEEGASQPSKPQEAAPAEEIPEKAKAKVKDVDTDMESDSAPASKPTATTTTASSALKVVDNFRSTSQPPSRPGSSLRQSKTVTKRAHVASAGRNRFSANNEEEEEDEEAVEKRNAELLAVANSSVFKVPEGFKFGVSPAPAASKPSTAPEVVSPQPVPAKPVAASILSFTPPTAPAKEASSPAPSFFGSKEAPKVAVSDVKNPFANLGATKPEIKVPEVPKWGSVPSSSAPTPPPKPVEGASPFANIGVSAKPVESAPVSKPAEKPASDNPFASIGKPAAENPFGKTDKPKPASENPFAGIGKSAGDGPFTSVGKPVGDNPFGGASKPAGDNPFAGIGANNKGVSPAPALPFSFGAPKPEGTSASTTPAPAAAPAVPSFFSKPAEAPKPAEPVEVPKPVAEAPKPAPEPPKPSPFSFGASKPAEKPAASPFSFGAPAAAPASTPAPGPGPSPFSFGAPSAPVPTPAAPAPTAKPAFAFGLPATTPSPAPSAPEAPKKNPFDFSAPAAAPTPVEAPKKNPFDFSAPAPSAPAPAPLAPTTSKSPFDFSSATKPTDKPASPFTFGATPTPAPAPAAPATTEKQNPFDFSGSSQKPASSSPFTFAAPSTSAPATTGFTFGAAPARANTPPPSGGDAAMEESPARDAAPSKIVTSGFGGTAGSGFGSQPASTGFAFGSNTNGTSSGPFGGANGASVTGPFGGPLNGTTQSNGLASATSASPAPFAFGTNSNASGGFGSAPGSGFGTSGSTAPPSTSGFTFGAGGGFGQTPSATASPSNPFSQPQPNPSPFGQPNPTPTNAFPTPASPFPAASPALSTVGFNTNPAPSNNAFGSAQPASNGFPSSPATPAFAFGAPNPTAGTASPSTFTFGLPGGTSAPATPTTTSSPFVFGQGAAPSGPEGSPAPGVQFNLGTADASPGGRKIKPLRRPRRN